ncbi:hypothetical protein [Pseudomonas sp. SJZ079]|nr:hypothetical protein [Pseudomonas sp. SJZ079]
MRDPSAAQGLPAERNLSITAAQHPSICTPISSVALDKRAALVSAAEKQ